MRTRKLLVSNFIVLFRSHTRVGRVVWLAGLLVVIAPMAAQAQSWSGILSPSRAVDWSTAGVLGGIPSRTTICATLSPGATAGEINNAISACPNGQVVMLSPGTYNLTDAIHFQYPKQVTLRGAGANQTKIVWTAATSISRSCQGPDTLVCFQSGGFNDAATPGHTSTWTAGYAQGTAVITLGSTSELVVGDEVFLDQLDDTDDGYPAAGNIYVCTSTSCTSQGGNNFGRSDRSQVQVVRVTAINGAQVTISPPLHMPNWRAAQTPGAWWGSQTETRSGIEDLTLDNSETTEAGSIIVFMNAMDCWVKGVRTVSTNTCDTQSCDRDRVMFYYSGNITVRDSYFYGTKSSTLTSYGLEVAMSTSLLVENNIFQHVTAPIVMNSPNSGSVFAYNYAIDDNYDGGWMQPMFVPHDNDGMALVEGNQGLGFQSDNIHGPHHFYTLFRNHFFGDIFANPVKTANTAIVHLWAKSRFFNLVGNVLGRTGYYDTYQSLLSSNSTDIYSLGEPDRGGVSDPRVQATLMRWGNYDTVTGTSLFVAAEVPSELSSFPNPLPPTQTLPASFYLSAKPSFFGSVPWPPIGPDVNGGDVTGYAGHAYRIPARLCYENTAIDSAYGVANVRLFNRTACYGQSGAAPSAPSNLRIVP
jgi:hypothetical protein